ncbi:MAG: family 10 glycosylhydrolase [Armatimonadetes bacterium]|nr:family 10 glycosylhydrolase [Armatimonadota bacterium]
MSRISLIFLTVFVLAALWAPQTVLSAEHRAFWVDAWGSGFESPSVTTAMLDYVDACNCNAVIVEMRKRGDAYYTSSYEPTGWNVTPDPGYDCLADIVPKAHARGLEVHAWVVVNRVWTFTTPPPETTPPHVYNAHPEWFSLTDSGEMYDSSNGSWLDPGHPEVENYHKNVFMEIISNYDIDGFCLDYIRYAGSNWGYNPTAVARYNAEYGLSGNPPANDSQWSDWRRDQVTNMVKRIYLEAKAVKPNIKIGAAIWNSSTTGRNTYFQDWDLWMQNHWLDYGAPMAYSSTNSTFNSWVDTYYNQQYGHHLYVIQGSYINTISNSMTQISYVQNKPMPGVHLYCYRVTNSGTVDREGFKSALLAGPFATYQDPPTMSWISSPTLGMLKGFVKNSNGEVVYPATVTIQGKSTKNSGTGFYGFVDLTPGTYTATASAPGYTNGTGQVTITAGQVATLDITLGSDTAPPIISNVRTSDVRATIAKILWDTDEVATSQVEYGPTSTYGYQTSEDMTLVTSHTVQLTGLVPSTLYHYRTKSKDAANNQAVSGDYTFMTASSEVVDDIIIDNPQCELYGSWSTGTSSTDKYGTNYYYCTTATSETKWAKWRPNILVGGNYDVYCWYPQGSNRSTRAPYTVYWNGGSQLIEVNQQINGGRWNLLVTSKPHVIGTTQYTKLGNGTGETSLNVMADAIKYVFAAGADTQPPSVPTNLGGNAVSPTRVDLSWTASTDNVGVAGYKVYRNGSQIGSTAATSYSDTTCTAGTTYTYTVSAYDEAQNESAQSSPAVVSTPAIQNRNYAPSSITLIRGTVASGSVSNLAANDASYLVINSQRVSNKYYTDWYSNVFISEVPSHVSKLTITYDGKLSSSQTQSLHLWNWTTSSWTQIDSRTVGTSDITINWSTTSPSNYISSSGEIRLRQYVDGVKSSFSCSADFVQFGIEYW